VSVNISHAFLTSAVDGGDWSDLYIGRFTPGEEHLLHTG